MDSHAPPDILLVSYSPLASPNRGAEPVERSSLPRPKERRSLRAATLLRSFASVTSLLCCKPSGTHSTSTALRS